MAEFLTGVKDKYPPQLLKGRLEVEGNVVSCMFKDMLLLDDSKLESKNFISQDGYFYFSLLKNLRKKGFYSLDEVTILSNSTDDVIERFNDCGGWESIKHQIDIINDKNFDTYLDILYRENIIMSLHSDGFNLFNEITLNDKKIVPIKLLRKMSAEEVCDFYNSIIDGYDCGQSSSILEEEEIDFDDTFFQKCKDGEECGVPFDIAGLDSNLEDMRCFPFLSSQTLGFTRKTLSMMAGFSSTGKSTWWITIIMALIYRGEKVLVISNEENSTKFKMKFTVWCLGKYFRYFKLTKSKLKAGNISKDDDKMLKQFSQYWKENIKGKIKFISLADANMNIVKKKIRENVLKYGYSTFLYDTFKMQEDDFKSQRQDLALVRDSRELDKLAKKYNLIGLASVQLSEGLKGKLFLDSSCLSNSKQIKEVLENLFLMRTMYENEMQQKDKYFCHPFQLKKVNDKWIEEEYHLDNTAVYRILFVEKTRDGNNSSDTGVAYILKFDGEHSIFREVAQCRPRHGKIE